MTTNAAENAFSQMDVRLKSIGRRWSLAGALNMVRVLLTKAFNKPHWEQYLALALATPGAVKIETRIYDVTWVS